MSQYIRVGLGHTEELEEGYSPRREAREQRRKTRDWNELSAKVSVLVGLLTAITLIKSMRSR